jgi:hypothetical protein
MMILAVILSIQFIGATLWHLAIRRRDRQFRELVS